MTCLCDTPGQHETPDCPEVLGAGVSARGDLGPDLEISPCPWPWRAQVAKEAVSNEEEDAGYP